MTPSNADVARSFYVRFNGGDKVPSLDFWHEDGEYQSSSEDPDSANHVGIDAIRRQVGVWTESYPDLTVEPLEIREQGDTVFVWVHFSGSGAASAPMDMKLAQVCTFRDGRIARVVEYMDRAEGLAAAGMGE